MRRPIRILVFLWWVSVLSGCQLENTRPAPVVHIDTRVEDNAETPGIYIVKPGDTLYGIAWEHELDVHELATWNGLRPPYTLRNGQKLRLTPPPKSIGARTKTSREISVGTPLTPQTPRLPKSKREPQGRVSGTNRSAHTGEKKPQMIASNKTKIKKKLKKSVTNWRWPVKGKIIGRFSPRRGGNKGIDILTPGPQPVVAVADGQVVYSGSGLRGYGKLVIIKHDDDWFTAYAYNARIRVKDKQIVKVGQAIADTGYEGLYANQLHFEVRFRGKPVDPLKYLPRQQ